MATKNGWYIRVCKTQTEASQIKLWIGLGGDSSTHRFWKERVSFQEHEFDLPPDLINVKQIWIRAEGIPDGQDVSMGVCYRDHVTQKMTFNHGEEHETSQGDSDGCEC